jgi:hypothetical protein
MTGYCVHDKLTLSVHIWWHAKKEDRSVKVDTLPPSGYSLQPPCLQFGSNGLESRGSCITQSSFRRAEKLSRNYKVSENVGPITLLQNKISNFNQHLLDTLINSMFSPKYACKAISTHVFSPSPNTSSIHYSFRLANFELLRQSVYWFLLPFNVFFHRAVHLFAYSLIPSTNSSIILLFLHSFINPFKSKCAHTIGSFIQILALNSIINSVPLYS